MFSRLVKSKTFWAGLASVATGVGLIINGDMTAGIPAIIIGIQSVLLRDAIAKK